MRFAPSSDRRWASGGSTLVERLGPGTDLRRAIDALPGRHRLRAAVLLAGVGSLGVATLRFAQRDAGTSLEGPFEIVSMTGTVSREGSHVHIAIADADGRTFGGHLLPGCIVRTTCELVLAELADWHLRRSLDRATGYRELRPRRRR